MLWRGHAFQGAASLADVPFWRKLSERLTLENYTLKGCFLKPNITRKITDIAIIFSIVYMICCFQL